MMFTVTDWLAADPAGGVIAGVAALAYAALKTLPWFDRLRRGRLSRALRFVEAAVRQVYEEYVRELKAARGDGKLTAEERRRARELARQRAIDLARTEGVDLVAEIGAAQLALWIDRLVQRIKTGR